jgi:hypothetical protein
MLEEQGKDGQTNSESRNASSSSNRCFIQEEEEDG